MSVKVFHKVAVPSHGMMREFSEEVHGKDYKEIALSYIDKYSNNVDHIDGLEQGKKEVVEPEVKEVKAKAKTSKK